VTTQPWRMKPPERVRRFENEKPGRKTGLFAFGKLPKICQHVVLAKAGPIATNVGC